MSLEMEKEQQRAIQIFDETLKFFDGDELRARVFLEKYALRDLDGNVVEKLPTEMWRRVAREIASVEPSEKRRSGKRSSTGFF
ncbi:hypothetical protein B9P99_01135, partial [Candidatus Marsarchaeota G1 archaeon OSP_B]